MNIATTNTRRNEPSPCELIVSSSCTLANLVNVVNSAILARKCQEMYECKCALLRVDDFDRQHSLLRFTSQ